MSAISALPQSLIGASAMGASYTTPGAVSRVQAAGLTRQTERPTSIDLGLDDEDMDAGPDRDIRVLRSARSRGAGRERLVPNLPGGARATAWGGALRRMSESGPQAPSREDEYRLTSVPGRYTPIGYARYTSPVVNPSDYEYYKVAGWRIAVPRSTPGLSVRDLVYRIFYFGPQSAGYARIGDTLVPSILGPGDRMTLAQSSIEFYAEPLSS